jgi:hypothetical protein
MAHPAAAHRGAFPPGGGTDIVGAIGQALAPRLGQPW